MHASACTQPELTVRVFDFLRKDFAFNIPVTFEPPKKFVIGLGAAHCNLQRDMTAKAATQLIQGAVAAAADRARSADQLGQRCAATAGREIPAQQLHAAPWP